MFQRQPQEGSTRTNNALPSLLHLAPSPSLSLLLLLLLLSSPPLSRATPPLPDSPPLLSLLVPWAEGPPGAGVRSLEALGEAPYLSSPGDERRFQAFLKSDRVQGLTGGPATPEEWESPKNPDLFLLTEVGGEGEEGRRRRGAKWDEDEAPPSAGMAAHRMKRTGGFVGGGGSRIRTGGAGGGFLGNSGARGGFGGFGPGRGSLGGNMGGRMNEGPSLSIVNPLDVLRQRLLLEIARRRMRESEDQIQANRELLKSIGKREARVGSGEAELVGKPSEDNKVHIQTPASM